MTITHSWRGIDLNILGINFAYHDSAACIIKDGKLLVAIEEERFTRQKHTRTFPEQAIKRCQILQA